MLARKLWQVVMMTVGASVVWVQSASAGLIITPAFAVSITSNANAANIEGAINTAISTIDGLYSNSVTIPVTFTYLPGAAGNLESNTGLFYSGNYSTYVSQLLADSAANPGNTVLATANANLAVGNDASGSAQMALAAAQLTMLGVSKAGNAVVNINSNQVFAFSRPVPSNQYDAVGGVEHELDEVLGGGGAGSTLNNCVSNPNFFCGKYGPTDLYRYSAPGTPSFTTSGAATSYFSINGGATGIVSFNQNSNGDYADFAPNGTGTGQFIQNAFNSKGQDEAYTSASLEFEMLESIGWDPSSATEPEPSTLILSGTGFALITLAANNRRKFAGRHP